LGAFVAVLLGGRLLRGAEPARTGPLTEKRFPPLKVPAGFKATLFACDPFIEYPSAICVGPRPGAIFVAIDYMTGLGTDIIRHDEIRLVEDTDGDGYADKATIFAQGFNSIQGLAYHDGTVFVMHAPYLTALRDTKGTGVADERRDLLTGLGLTPEQNPVRLHCANGVVAGHDGWLYLALGDHGVDVPRPEGDRLVIHGGGILRCRPDGGDLHVFATGLRNIYDVALDAELNVFVRDNENDGGTYKIRVCHSFYGADHGYPYLYEERPDEALPPLADLGLGSSAGGLCYLEQQFPPQYHGSLFFCEWGRSVVYYRPRPAGSSFGPIQEIEFAAGASNDPYGFKPTDLVVQRDGTLMVADWADDQRPKRGRGRIYHIAYRGSGAKRNAPKAQTGETIARLIAQLDSVRYCERWDAQMALQRLGGAGQHALSDALQRKRLGVLGRQHALWQLTHIGEQTAIDDLMRLAQSDPQPSIRAQAVRALADLADPVLTRHRLDAGPGDASLTARLAALDTNADQRLLREVVIALGRLRWAGLPEWLRQHLDHPDPALAHAAMQALRRCGNWSEILKLLDQPADSPIRAIARRATAVRFEPQVVNGLLQRLGTTKDAARRLEYADTLARVYKKPGAWVYWNYRPAPRPANTVSWERTEAIGQALEGMLADANRDVRVAVLARMRREGISFRPAALGPWLADEYQADRAAMLLAALADRPAADSRSYLMSVIRNRRHSLANRRTALARFTDGINEPVPVPLLALAQELEDGPILADVLARIGKHAQLPAVPLLIRKLTSPSAEVRAAAIQTLGELGAAEGRAQIPTMLHDADARVRAAAAEAAGRLAATPTIDTLLKLLSDADQGVRRACLDALRRLREPRAVPPAVAALGERPLQLTALAYLEEQGSLAQAGPVTGVAMRDPSDEVLAAAVRVLTTWGARKGVTVSQRQVLDGAVAEIHGAHGTLVRWNAHAPVAVQAAAPLIARFAVADRAGTAPDWQTRFTMGNEGRLPLPTAAAAKDTVGIVYTDVVVPEPTPVEFLASSSGSLQVWLNGRPLYQRNEVRNFRIDSDRFAGNLARGYNRLLVQLGPSPTVGAWHMRFRRKSAKADHERLIHAALSRTGDAERGRRLFFDSEKALCLKCHRLGDQGERIGPELTGVGSRFARIYLVESILEPSRSIPPSFATTVIALKDGKALTGVKIAETETTVTLADNQGQKHLLTKADIEEQQASPVSTMPDGLEKRFTEEEFVDLIAFLASQKDTR
jgi:putative membrane-bound dehydrogenase-like protein